MSSEEIAKAVTSGTTLRPNQVQVIYNDGVKALVKWPGGKAGGSLGGWVSGSVTLYDIRKAKPEYRGDHIWDLDRSQPLTRKRLLHICTQHDLEVRFLAVHKHPTDSIKFDPRFAPVKGGA